MVFLVQQKVPSRDILQSCPQIFYMQYEHLISSLFPEEEPLHTLSILARGLYEGKNDPTKSRKREWQRTKSRSSSKVKYTLWQKVMHGKWRVNKCVTMLEAAEIITKQPPLHLLLVKYWKHSPISLYLAMSGCPSKRSSKTVQEVIQQSHLYQYQSFDNSGDYLILTDENFHNLIYTRGPGSLRIELLFVLGENSLASLLFEATLLERNSGWVSKLTIKWTGHISNV